MDEELPWPPRKEDLERLYLVEELSAAKIAKRYHLKYKNPKVAESTVLYHLKRNGIRRRDPDAHVRKVTEEMVGEWIVRYQEGESLKQIAASGVSPVTVFLHLRKRGVELRDKVEAQIRAVAKYERRPFRGEGSEKAYLMGLRYGDLHVVKHGRAIRVRVSTTHRAMAELFENLFGPYSHVSRYPRRAKLVGYEWTLECDLGESFQFLLSKPSLNELRLMPRAEKLAFLAGFFDAEGSVLLHNKRGRYNPELAFTNSEETILGLVAECLHSLGIHYRATWVIQEENRQGVTGYSKRGQVVVWRFLDVQSLLRIMPIKHGEKLEKARIVEAMVFRSGTTDNLESARKWEALVTRIHYDVEKFAEKAAAEIAHRDRMKDPAR